MSTPTPINLPGGNVVIPGLTVLGNPNSYPAPIIAMDNQSAHAAVHAYRNAGSIGAPFTVDLSLGVVQRVTLTANTTLTFTNPQAGTEYILLVTQDAVGTRTITWPASVKWSAGTAPTLTATAAKVDMITLVSDGTNYYPSAAPVLNC